MLDEFQTFCELKSGGASYHPDEGVGNFSSLILVMSSSSEALLDHKADFLKFISKAQSFWFSLDTSYDHGKNDDGEGQQGDRRHEDDSGWHDDGKG
jgi:hypothetical protein